MLRGSSRTPIAFEDTYMMRQLDVQTQTTEFRRRPSNEAAVRDNAP